MTASATCRPQIKGEVAANPPMTAIKKTTCASTCRPAHRSVRLEDRQVARRNRQDQGRRRLRRPDPVARSPQHPVGMADDGYVLEYRNSDAGKKMFGGNADKETHQPKFMWDAKKMSAPSRSPRTRSAQGRPFPDPRAVNAVPFDPKAGWKAGDMIPDYVTAARTPRLGGRQQRHRQLEGRHVDRRDDPSRSASPTMTTRPSRRAASTTSASPCTTTTSPRAVTRFPS